MLVLLCWCPFNPALQAYHDRLDWLLRAITVGLRQEEEDVSVSYHPRCYVHVGVFYTGQLCLPNAWPMLGGHPTWLLLEARLHLYSSCSTHKWLMMDLPGHLALRVKLRLELQVRRCP